MDKNYIKDNFLIGMINLSEEDILTLNEDEIGKLNTGKITILVFSKERNIPHFHVRNSDKSIDTCIRIDDNVYYKHGTHTTQLNHKLYKILNDFLKSKHKKFNNRNNWEEICLSWNKNNPQYEKDFSKIKQPDYSNIREK